MATSVTVLLVACLAFITYETFLFWNTTSQNLDTLAEIIGSNSTASLTFDDVMSAEETLSALRAEAHVTAACIYRVGGEVFAKYIRAGEASSVKLPAHPGEPGLSYENGHLVAFRPITLGIDHIGTIFIQYDLQEMYSRLGQYLVILFLIVILALLVAFLLSTKLQRIISGPVLHLADVARQVSKEKNYSVRAIKTGQDELGQLVEVFNAMLTHIQERDQLLLKIHGELEQHVNERTRELQHEIVKHQDTEANLEKSVSLLNATLESTIEGILVVDLNSNIVSFNQRFVELWNLPQDVVASRSDSRALSIAAEQLVDPDAFLHKVHELYAHPEKDSFDILEFKDGRIFERYSHPQRIGGKSVGRVWSFQDISERRRSDELIREQATLLEKAQDAILARSLDHKVLFWNKSAERLYGWSRDEALGKNVNELLFKEPDVPHQAFETVLKRNEWTGELHQVTREGKIVVVESRWTLVRDNEGKPKSILVINTDITEKKQLEAQFLRAQRLESIGTLAAGIAHDFNNVLSPVLMSVDMLKMRHTDPHTQHVLSLLETNSMRGADLVKQLLGFARGVEGKRVPIQLKHLMREIEKVVSETFPKSVIISTNASRDLWSFIGDPTHAHQVLMNLCVNARDAIAGEGSISITAENVNVDEGYARRYLEAKVGPYVLVKVTDSGSGMPKEILNKIFDPFFTTKEPGKGTGLGLSTVVAVVRRHGGFLNVYSEVGKGTTFSVYLPAALSAEAVSEGEKAGGLIRGNGELILVVDDEIAIREVTKETLNAFGYRTLTACDGLEALEVFRDHRDTIAAVITDMMMPHCGGLDAIKAIREIDSETRIIAVSGLTSYERHLQTASLGVHAFLTKPYTSEKMLSVLREVLDYQSVNA